MGVAGLSVLSIGLSWVRIVSVVTVHGAGGCVEVKREGLWFLHCCSRICPVKWRVKHGYLCRV